jgi:hypothetical protein
MFVLAGDLGIFSIGVLYIVVVPRNVFIVASIERE